MMGKGTGDNVGRWDGRIEGGTEFSQVEWGSVSVGMKREERETASI